MVGLRREKQTVTPSTETLSDSFRVSIILSLPKEGPLGKASKRQGELTKRNLQKNNALEVVRVDVILLPVQINMPLRDTKPLHSERARSPGLLSVGREAAYVIWSPSYLLKVSCTNGIPVPRTVGDWKN